MNKNDITVVIAIKNRDCIRAKRCVNSLLDQNYPCKIIIVDYGSDDKSWYSEVFGNNRKITLIKVTKNTKIFNKSRALNIGFKHANSKYILSTDIDCIFAINFIKEVMKALTKNKKIIVLSQKIDLDKEGKEIETHEPSASGSCIAINSKWINKVHGYDEFYTCWGREDNDLVDRAVADGYEIIWITDKTKIYHQWHLTANQSTIKDNDLYYRIPSKPIIRNPNKWGEI
jgi:GT2 family glycosyltransferase